MSRRLRRAHKRRRRASRRRRVAAGTAAAVCALPAVAQAEDFTVTTLTDSPSDNTCDANCSIRDALFASNLNNNGPVADRILFKSGLSGTLQVLDDPLEVDDTLEIVGPGASVIALDGNAPSHQTRVLQTNPQMGEAVTIEGLTIRDGVSLSGAGITAYQGSLTLRDSVVAGNTATTSDGGGIWALAPLTVERSVISGNSAGGNGGGIVAVYATEVRDSTISGNHTDNNGGGIHSYRELTVERSTISGNTADSKGAGILARNQTDLALRNSTVSGNIAASAGGGIAVYDIVGAEVSNSTIAGNEAVAGGGISALSQDVTLDSSIVADNVDTGGLDSDPDLQNIGGSFLTSFSLVEHPSPASNITETVPGSNITGADPGLAGLADNGGPTLTRALALSSPAVDQGLGGGLTTDQRGLDRVFDFPEIANSAASGADGADIGSFEARPLPPVTARCRGKTATIVGGGGLTKGTGRRDVIVGTGKHDLIKGRGGNDLICALGGNDRVLGGGGKDTILGGRGRDKLLGQGGRDKLLGQGGRDLLIGGPGRDKLRGGPGRDRQRQ